MESKHPTLILPKGYLSWSQMDRWCKSPAQYIKEYFEDGAKLDTRYTRFGSRFSKMVETLGEIMAHTPDRYTAIQILKNDYPMDERMEAVLMDLDIEGVSEYQIGNSGKEGDRTPVCKVRGLVPILAFLDKYPRPNIGEYKTGLAPWTMAKVQKHDQLPYYGVGLKWSGQPLPQSADLHWIETVETEMERVDFWRDGEKVISATGIVKTFHREFDEREFERMEERIIKVAYEISDAYQDHLGQL